MSKCCHGQPENYIVRPSPTFSSPVCQHLGRPPPARQFQEAPSLRYLKARGRMPAAGT